MLSWGYVGEFNPWAVVLASMMGLFYWYGNNDSVETCMTYGICG
jgi:hypothetical protein